MLNKLDPEVEKFIDRRIHSPLDIEILVYFYQNLVTVESPKEIAKCLKQDIKRVAKALHRFESHGIVHNMATGKVPLYVYSASDNLHLVIERFVKLASSPHRREAINIKLIANGKL